MIAMRMKIMMVMMSIKRKTVMRMKKVTGPFVIIRMKR